jgi:hypothetical protein
VVRKRPAAEDEVDCVEVLDHGGILVHEDKVTEREQKLNEDGRLIVNARYFHCGTMPTPQ